MLQVLCIYIMVYSFLGFVGFLLIQMCVYMSICVSWTFSLVIFLLSFDCPILDILILCNFILLLFWMYTFILVTERKKRFGWLDKEDVGVFGRNWGKGNYNQNVLYLKFIYNKKL